MLGRVSAFRNRAHPLIGIALCVALAGCAMTPLRAPADAVALPAAPVTDQALEDRILALDPELVTANDVNSVLAKGPAPRIMLLHGGIYPVHLLMASFGRF